MRKSLTAALTRAVLALACIAGASGHAADGSVQPGAVDSLGRLTSYPGKKAVACSAQDGRTAVLLLIGQSNTANLAEKNTLPHTAPGC